MPNSMKKQIITLDFWGTLCRGNPDFRAAKNDLVRSYFNRPSLVDEDIEAALNETKAGFNLMVEEWGVQPDQSTMYARWLTLLGIRFSGDPNQLSSFIGEYHELALDYPALDFDENTEEAIRLLDQKASLVIVSNTLFIRGYVIEKWIKNKSWGKCISVSIFSDRYNASKPNRMIFRMLNHYQERIIYHVGDNARTDGQGAEYKGIPFLGVNGHYGLTLLNAAKQITAKNEY